MFNIGGIYAKFFVYHPIISNFVHRYLVDCNAIKMFRVAKQNNLGLDIALFIFNPTHNTRKSFTQGRTNENTTINHL